MTTNFTKTLTCLLALISLSACELMTGETTETIALKEAAIADAHKAPEKVKLNYARCYALINFEKEQCHQMLGANLEKRSYASAWEYIHPFDEQLEREGLAATLRSFGKNCAGLENDPQLESLSNATYLVKC